MKEILDRASKENYGVAAPNIYSSLDAKAFIEAAEEMNAPLILDIAFLIHDKKHLGHFARELARDSKVPVAINLDHGDSIERVVQSIQAGFTSVMFDRSVFPYDEHVALMKEAVKIAHAAGVSVEAEFGHVGETDNYEASLQYKTVPSEAKRFVEDTGVDCLAVAIGSAHGIYPKGVVPKLDIELLKEIKKEVNGLPLVLHGSSGTTDEDLVAACSNGINKINICGELLESMIKDIKETDLSYGNAYNVYTVARQALKRTLKEKIKLYGSENKAWAVEPEGIDNNEDVLVEH